MTQYPVAPTNAILMGGVPLYMEFEAAEGSAILPGDLVQFNNPPGDCTIKEGADDSAEVIGVADIAPIGITLSGGSRTDVYLAGQGVQVIRGAITVALRVATSNAIQCGEWVQPAPSGEVKAFVCGTDNECQQIAQALATTASSTLTFQWQVFYLHI